TLDRFPMRFTNFLKVFDKSRRRLLSLWGRQSVCWNTFLRYDRFGSLVKADGGRSRRGRILHSKTCTTTQDNKYHRTHMNRPPSVFDDKV
ncbi:MAG: hypothetical protein DRP63_03430, partial [Planctomycetota bacterium]